MKFDKDDTFALVGTLVIHIILLAALYFGVLSCIIPQKDIGIIIAFADASTINGGAASSSNAAPARQGQTQAQPQQRQVQPQQRQPQPQTQRQSQPQQRQPQQQPQQRQTQPQTSSQTTNQPPARAENVVTQNRQQTAAVQESEKPVEAAVADAAAQRAKEESERRQREENERRQREEAQRQQEAAISNQVGGAFNRGNQQGQGQSDMAANTSGSGNPFSNSSTGTGGGGTGVGPSFNLSGRSLVGAGGLPRPDYTIQEEGRIVINITVDPNGNVIAAEIGRGTNIDNTSLRNSALNAAKRAKFNKIQGTNNQNGTITYNYRLT